MRMYSEAPVSGDRELLIDNLLVRINFIIAMIWWTGFTPRGFQFPVAGRLISTFFLGTLNRWPLTSVKGATCKF